MNYILQYILPSILGDYIQDIDKNKMKTSLFSGTVGLEGVSLNPKILKSFDLPIKMAYSRIGKLELKIPWMKRLKEPTELLLEDLLIVFTLTSEMKDFNIVKERIKFLDRVLEECIERMKVMEKDDKDQKKDSESNYKVLIIDNLQLKIKNIHIRLENPKDNYATGITLDEISIQTVDENGNPKFFDRTLKENKTQDMKKKAIMKDLSFYWNSQEQSNKFVSGDNVDMKIKNAFLLDNIVRTEKKKSEIEPLLTITLSSSLTIKNLGKVSSERQPRYKIDITLKPIKLMFTSKQISQMIELGDYIKKIKVNRKNKYELPELDEKEIQSLVAMYKDGLTKAMEEFDDSTFKWVETLKKANQGTTEVKIVRSCLSKLPNRTLAEATKEAIIQGIKKSMVKKIEKKHKKSKKSEFSDEMTKLQEYFESFDQEEAEVSIQNLTEDFLFQVNFLLDESKISIINLDNGHGVESTLKTMLIILEKTTTEEYDAINAHLSIKDIQLDYIQKYSNSQDIKRFPIAKKSSYDEKNNLIYLNIQKKGNNKQSYIDINGEVKRMEIRFVADFVVTLKTLFNFNNSQDSEFQMEAYEKLSEMQKNAGDQIKSMLNYYYSFMTVNMKCSTITVIVPLNSKLLDDSDSWILAIESMQVGTRTDPSKERKIEKYSKFFYEVNDINVKYFKKISDYYSEMNGEIDEESLVLNFLEKTSVVVDLQMLSPNFKHETNNSNEVEVSIRVGRIEIDFNKFIYTKLTALNKCFDFSNEKDINEFLETEKKLILKHNDGLYKVQMKEGLNWNHYFGVLSGFYFYLYKNQSDLRYHKYIYIRNAKVKVESNQYSHAHVLSVQGKYEIVTLAFETEIIIDKFKSSVENKVYRKLQSQISFHINDSDLSISGVSQKEVVNIPVDLKKNIIFFIVTFEGLTLNLKEDLSIKNTNQIIMNTLALNVHIHPLDTLIRMSLKELHFADIKAEQISKNFAYLLSSGRQNYEEPSKNDLVTLDFIIYDERHPIFEKMNNMTEFDLKFNSLDVIWMPDRIYFLKTFFENVFGDNSAKDEFGIVTTVSASESDTPKKQIRTKREVENKVKLTSGRISVNQMSMTLVTRVTNIELAKFSIKDLAMKLDFHHDHQVYSGSLKKIQLFDLTNYQQSKSQEILPFELMGVEEGNSILKFELQRRSEAYLNENKTRFANDFQVDCSSLKIIYLHQPIMRIVTYVTNFILSFRYGENLSYIQQQNLALSTISNPTFNNIRVKFNNPKLILIPVPDSKVSFEVDLGLIEIKNSIFEKNARILKKMSLEKIFVEEYEISIPAANISKVITDGSKTLVSNNFPLNFTFERCLMYEEYILYENILQKNKYEHLNNSYMINGNTSSIILRLTQEDYIDFMDVAMMNLAFDDMRDVKFYLDEELVVEMKDNTLPAPINFNFEAEYISFLAIDQLFYSPLAKLMLIVNKISFQRLRSFEKKILMSSGKVGLSSFDRELDDSGTEKIFTESIIIGENFKERTVSWKPDIDFSQNLFDRYLLYADKLDVKKFKNEAIVINAVLKTVGDKEIEVDIKNYKMILQVGKLMRIRDFLMFYNRIVIDDEEISKITPNHRKMMTVRVTMKESEAFLLSEDDSALILKGNIIFDLQKFDPNDCKLMTADFLPISLMNFNVYDFEFLILCKNSKYVKKNIVLPFIITYKTKEEMVFEKSTKKFVSKTEKMLFLDKITMRVGASDTTSLWASFEKLLLDYNFYTQQPLFPKYSKYTDHSREELDFNQAISTVIYDEFKIMKNGLQIYIIDDSSGVSIPVFYISFVSSNKNNEIIIEHSMGVTRSTCGFQVLCSYFNTNVAIWEPILEKFVFDIEYEKFEKNDFTNKIEIYSKEEPLNVNISNEMFSVIFTAYYNWKNHFDRKKSVKIQPKFAYSYLDLDLMKAIADDGCDIEMISISKVWNDTGFEFTLLAQIVKHSDAKNFKKTTLNLSKGDRSDLLIDFNLGKDISIPELGTLDKIKADLRFKIPSSKDILALNIDIDTPGIRSYSLKFSKDKEQILLVHVFTENQKKIIRFTSSVIIDNNLTFPIFLHVHENEGEGSILEIKPNSSSSLPLDKIYNYVSFHREREYPEREFNRFCLIGFNNYRAAELSFSKRFAIISASRHPLYEKIVLEPIWTIQNCLPFSIAIDVTVKDKQIKNNFVEVLPPQGNIYLDSYSIDADIIITFSTQNFQSNQFRLNRNQELQSQTLEFKTGRAAMRVNLQRPVIPGSYTYRYIIAGFCCVINETQDDFVFYTINSDMQPVPSPFSVNSEDKELVLFSRLHTMRISTRSELNNMSEALEIPTAGDYTVDVPSKMKGYMNLAVRVTNQLACPLGNIFNKIITISPRYIFCNKTEHTISIFQTENPSGEKVILIPNEKEPFHFRKAAKDRNIQILLSSAQKDLKWLPSGILEVSSPGDIQFLCQTQDLKSIKYFNLNITPKEHHLYLTLEEQDQKECLIQIENTTDVFDLLILQNNTKNICFRVPPKSRIPFAWPNPSSDHRFKFFLGLYGEDSDAIYFKFDTVNKIFKDKISFKSGSIQEFYLYYCVLIEDGRKILKVSTTEHNLAPVETSIGSDWGIDIQLYSIGVSLITTKSLKKCELMYFNLSPVRTMIISHENSITLQFEVKDFIVDNNLLGEPIYPLAVSPKKASKNSKAPAINFVLAVKNKTKHGILHISNIQFYLDEMMLSLCGLTLNAISEYIRSAAEVYEESSRGMIEYSQYLFLSEEKRDSSRPFLKSWLNMEASINKTNYVYLEKVKLYPINMILNYNNSMISNDSYISSFLKTAVGKALANFENAHIDLAGIELKQIYGTKDTVKNLFINRYSEVAKGAVLNLFFSSGLIGNPNKFFSKISDGFVDLVEKPSEGFLEGPVEGFFGTVHGAGSLAIKTVGATFGSLHSITGSLASGLATLTGDKEYMKEREQNNRKKSKNIFDGGFKAITSVAGGVIDGVTGVVVKPIEGASKDGVKGLFKGIFGGVKGLVFQPVAGVLDGVSKLTEGVSNNLSLDDEERINKSRNPRIFYGYERIYKTYSKKDATIYNALAKFKRRFENFTVMDSVYFSMQVQNQVYNACLWMTLQKLFCFIFVDKKFQLVWKISVKIIDEVCTDSKSVKLVLKKKKHYLEDNIANMTVKDEAIKGNLYFKIAVLKSLYEETKRNERF